MRFLSRHHEVPVVFFELAELLESRLPSFLLLLGRRARQALSACIAPRPAGGIRRLHSIADWYLTATERMPISRVPRVAAAAV